MNCLDLCYRAWCLCQETDLKADAVRTICGTNHCRTADRCACRKICVNGKKPYIILVCCSLIAWPVYCCHYLKLKLPRSTDSFRRRIVVIWKHFCFILSTGTTIRIDSVMRPRSSSIGGAIQVLQLQLQLQLSWFCERYHWPYSKSSQKLCLTRAIGKMATI